MYNTTSNFPVGIDDLLFISDVDYPHKEIFETHKTYLNNGQYSQASDFINSQNGITPIVADLFNLINNRIIALQSYLLESDKCNRATYNSEPISPVNEEIWISDIP